MNRIVDIAARSSIAQFTWKDRGRAPPGYIKGMALAFARVHVKMMKGDPAVAEMAKPDTGDALHDALAWYRDVFADLGMHNDQAGTNTLRHVFVLLFGLGMRESSGKHCEGRDRSADNVTADTAEAGLFQASFNIVPSHPVLETLFSEYSANPSGFLDVFREGVHCSASSLENFGSGQGMAFQKLSKDCPAFAAEIAAAGLRSVRTHWGPINRREAQVRPECDAMLQEVQATLDASPELRVAVA